MIIYTDTRGPKRKKSRTLAQIRAETEIAVLLQQVGYTGKAKLKKIKPEPKIEEPTRRTIPTSDTIPTGVVCSKKSVDDWKWKKTLPEENKHTAEEIENKKKRVGIAYNKGNYVYITPQTDTKTLGKK